MLKRLLPAFAVLAATYSFAAAMPLAPQSSSHLPVVRAADGCGRGMFRTLAGNCVPNMPMGVGPRGRVIAPPPCPRGYLRDPNPNRPLCYPAY